MINTTMPANAAYVTFLMKYSEHYPVLDAVLKNTYLYDITFTINGNISEIESELKRDAKFVEEFQL